MKGNNIITADGLATIAAGLKLTPNRLRKTLQIAELSATALSEDGERVPIVTRAIVTKSAQSWNEYLKANPELDTEENFMIHAGAFFAGAVAAAQDFRNALTLGAIAAEGQPADPSDLN